jgi:short-subunit dehydrogenase
MSAREPVVLITGASAGIGTELARVFARNGHRLAIIARRGEKLEKLADEIASAGRPRPLVLTFDLTLPDAGDRIDTALARENLEPQFVVNNAGFGLIGAAVARDRKEQLDMIELNVRTLTDFSLRWIDSLTRHRGGLLNVASVAGFIPGPGSAVYYATKAFVVSFSEALHQEWRERGVRVTALCPGPVPTEFQARAGVSEGMQPGLAALPASRVAEEGYRGLMAGRRLVVPGFINKLIVAVAPFLPRQLLLAAVDRRQRLRRRG